MPLPGERADTDLRGKDTEYIERLSLHTYQYVNRGKKMVAVQETAVARTES